LWDSDVLITPRHDLGALLGGADAVVLSRPHTPATAGLLGPAELEALKPGRC